LTGRRISSYCIFNAAGQVATTEEETMSILTHFEIDLSDSTEATVAPLTDNARSAFAVFFGAGAVSVNIPKANVDNLLNSCFEVMGKRGQL
jgi:hypothetical protein